MMQSACPCSVHTCIPAACKLYTRPAQGVNFCVAFENLTRDKLLWIRVKRIVGNIRLGANGERKKFAQKVVLCTLFWTMWVAKLLTKFVHYNQKSKTKFCPKKNKKPSLCCCCCFSYYYYCLFVSFCFCFVLFFLLLFFSVFFFFLLVCLFVFQFIQNNFVPLFPDSDRLSAWSLSVCHQYLRSHPAISHNSVLLITTAYLLLQVFTLIIHILWIHLLSGGSRWGVTLKLHRKFFVLVLFYFLFLVFIFIFFFGDFFGTQMKIVNLRSKSDARVGVAIMTTSPADPRSRTPVPLSPMTAFVNAFLTGRVRAHPCLKTYELGFVFELTNWIFSPAIRLPNPERMSLCGRCQFSLNSWLLQFELVWFSLTGILKPGSFPCYNWMHPAVTKASRCTYHVYGGIISL